MSVATFAAAQILRALPRTRVSRAVGRLCDAELHPAVCRALIGVYARAYDVDLAECAVGRGPYRSFDEFFTRKLRPGTRIFPVDEDEIASPADGRIEAIGTIEQGGTLLIKGRSYGVRELIGDSNDVGRYEGGQFAVVYLSPRDYHRVHAPVDGAVTYVRSMPGDLFPVNAIGERHVPALFARNRRVAIVIDTPKLGRVTVVMVGAIIVGRITVTAVPGKDVPIGVHRIDPPLAVHRGDEIGVFHLGSTAIVFLEPGKCATLRRAPGPVRLGQALTRDT